MHVCIYSVLPFFSWKLLGQVVYLRSGWACEQRNHGKLSVAVGAIRAQLWETGDRGLQLTQLLRIFLFYYCFLETCSQHFLCQDFTQVYVSLLPWQKQ